MTVALSIPPDRFAAQGGIVYLSGSSNPDVVRAASKQSRLGMLAQPGNAYHRHGVSFNRWAIDNGAFGKALRGKPWTDDDTETYLAYLARVIDESELTNVLFATAPDVLEFVDGGPRGDAVATWAQPQAADLCRTHRLRLGRRHLHRLRPRPQPAQGSGVAGQDRHDPDTSHRRPASVRRLNARCTRTIRFPSTEDQ